ncbi:MazG-like nucleotide pyrophosphohydrolase family protein [Brevibacterium sanguinis]|uniref:MazG-like nucleotide pyrophosphohydrolase family protein n=2 Tax=Brevibacterium TaxID=1696 RepID=A0A366IIM8_9MICO|nr:MULTISPECIES: MazG nucleotide pyrophosphohydrolase domain-containing protein [Brevibacterium]RBP63666.1 MazG-like nucleotide pyrophosphohydrolase family protein [Brevibacterium sanguinis]RBP70325.1 MazG-like nucleotide pyrophosphohydrolase family protein [Brevibacterium celere]
MTGAAGFDRVVEAMATLRRRCPWSSAQDHESLEKFAREETEELIEALEDYRAEPTARHRDAVIEELGDVFYQVLFHSALLDESGDSVDGGTNDSAAGGTPYGRTLQLIVDRLEEKLVRRHPFAFGEGADDSTMAPLAAVEAEYSRIKSLEKQRKDAAG